MTRNSEQMECDSLKSKEETKEPKYDYNTEIHKWLVTLDGSYTREKLIEIIKALNYSTDKRD